MGVDKVLTRSCMARSCRVRAQRLPGIEYIRDRSYAGAEGFANLWEKLSPEEVATVGAAIPALPSRHSSRKSTGRHRTNPAAQTR